MKFFVCYLETGFDRFRGKVYGKVRKGKQENILGIVRSFRLKTILKLAAIGTGGVADYNNKNKIYRKKEFMRYEAKTS